MQRSNVIKRIWDIILKRNNESSFILGDTLTGERLVSPHGVGRQKHEPTARKEYELSSTKYRSIAALGCYGPIFM